VRQARRYGETELDRAGRQIAGRRTAITSPRLNAEQRRALELLATADRDGVPQALLSAHGFDASLIAELVDRGLATLTAEKVRAGGKLIAVTKARITAAGREALAADP